MSSAALLPDKFAPRVTVDATAYAEFLRSLGHRVFTTQSAHWYDVSRLFFLSAPPHRLYDPSDGEVRDVLRQRPCLGLRFATALSGRGKMSYQIVCDTREYGLDFLSANVRSKVRRGLKRCMVGPVPFPTLATAGLRAHRDTLDRQGRESILSGERWERFWAAAAATPGFEGWGAWTGDVLAAFLVTVAFDEGVEFLLARSCSDELGAYPNNALIFHVAEEMLVRRGVPEITFGLESLEPVAPLDQFKFGMGFRARPLRQRVVFHPVLRALLRHPSVRRRFYRWADRKGAGAVFRRKAAGLLRFAEEDGL
ncbi:MAG TPA: hypothetical protein VL403_08005 [Candidatus Kryptonia bacterium]|nr:hypothetical protein [Candidatus Kryptonia bacterium]